MFQVKCVYLLPKKSSSVRLSGMIKNKGVGHMDIGDGISLASGRCWRSKELVTTRRRRTRTAKVRTALSCPCPAGQTDTGQSFFWKSGQNPDTGQNRDRQNPDRQTSDMIFYKIPDRIRTADRIETDRIRTDRHRTENPDRIQTADRHRTDLSGKFRPRIATG